MKFLKRSVWVLLSAFFAVAFLISLIGSYVAESYSAQLNSMFGINPYERVEQEDPNEDTEYYKSDYYKADGSYDDTAMRNNSVEVSRQVGVEGSVLLWNDNNALPLAKKSKVSLFGITAVDYLFGGEGSGHISVTTTETLKSALEAKDISVNDLLWNAYRLNRSSYGRRTNGREDIDPNYVEFKVGEVPWKALNSTTFGNVSSSIAQYGDAAIMLISRNGSENGDLAFATDECLDNTYVDLSKEEAEVLTQLQQMKRANTVKKIILLINTANAMQFKHIREYDIDACMWVGMGGNASFRQLADLLSGDATPSGHLVDTYVYDVDSAPANENFGNFVFAQSAGVPVTETYTHNTKYVVYQEGIYVGYRYYETRYEDSVLGKGNANSAKGVVAGSGAWKYEDEVAFPFGYGLSYTTFKHSAFSVRSVGGNYEVSMSIQNAGTTYSGKDVMQVYIQKPYTDYDKAHGVEKASVELVGFAKTKLLAPGESQTLTVTVKAEDFKTYDAYGAKTYILEKGDYYLAVGTSAHDAINNILAAKKHPEVNGDAQFVNEIEIKEDDFKTYSTSSATNNPITNQFDDADINLYEGTKGQEITYLSRNDWNLTYPSAVSLTCVSETMVRDMQYGEDPAVNEGDEMPLYDTVGQYGVLTLAMLLKTENGDPIPYDDPLWDELLNQLTWEESSMLVTYGANAVAGAVSVAAPGAQVKDGPGGIGIKNANLDSLMAFPSETLMAATWNIELIEKVGNAFGMEIMHVGYMGIYGPGANMHRSAYGGRTWEYFSEDGFMTGKMFAAETRGLQNRGIMLFTKHFALNDQEWNRYGGTVWANEQSIREIYLKGFEIGIVEGNCNGLMSSFNRIGCTWAGAHGGLLTEVLRNEWGFIGIVETDAGVGAHMTRAVSMAEGVIAGNDLWMTGGNPGAFNSYRDNPTVCLAIREACHRILYTQLHSNAMNGVGTTTAFRMITPWWKTTLTSLTAGFGVVMGACVIAAVAAFVVNAKSKNN